MAEWKASPAKKSKILSHFEILKFCIKLAAAATLFCAQNLPKFSPKLFSEVRSQKVCLKLKNEKIVGICNSKRFRIRWTDGRNI